MYEKMLNTTNHKRSKKPQWYIIAHQLRWLLSKRKGRKEGREGGRRKEERRKKGREGEKRTNTAEGVEEPGPLCPAGETVNRRNCYRKQGGGSSKTEKQNYHMTHQFHFWVSTESKARSQWDIYTLVSIAEQLTTAKRGKQSKHPPPEDGMLESGMLHSLKREETLTHDTACVSPEDTTQVEYERHKRTSTTWWHFHAVSKVVKRIETETRMTVTREEETGGWCLMGTEAQICTMRRFWRFVSQQHEHP